MSELKKCQSEEAGINDPENVPQNVPESIFQNVTEKCGTKKNRKRKRNENLEEENLKIIKACKYCHPETLDFAKEQRSPDHPSNPYPFRSIVCTSSGQFVVLDGTGIPV